MDPQELSPVTPFPLEGVIDTVHEAVAVPTGGKKRILWVLCREGGRTLTVPLEMRGSAADIPFVPGTAFTFDCVPFGHKVQDRVTGKPKCIYGLRSYRFRPLRKDSACKGDTKDLSAR